MDLNELSTIIVNLLEKTDCLFVRINLFDIASHPSQPTRYIVPVPTSSSRQCTPLPELPLIRPAFLYVHGWRLSFR